MIRDVLKTATKAATTWIGQTLGGPKGAAIGAKVGESVGGALFDKKSIGGGEFQLIDTSVQVPRFGGRLGFNASRMAGGAKGYAETVNPDTLYAAWDRRLGKYYSDKYKVARTVIGKKRVV